MINDKTKIINKSSTLALQEKSKELKSQGKDVISLSVGQPDFPTPEYIKKAGKKAVDENKTKYTASSGIKELKTALIESYKREQGFGYSLNEVIVHPGGKYSIFLIANTVLKKRDRTLIPTPYWVSYPEIIKFSESEPVYISCWDGEKFNLSFDIFYNEIKKGIKLFILNSPSNPTGAIFKEKSLKKLLEASLEYDFYILVDECYRRIIFDKVEYPSPLKIFPEAKDKILISGSFSKTYSMTGWRIGYTFGNSKIIDYMGRTQSHSTSNPTSISQYAALEALKNEKDEVEKMVKEYENRRDIVYNLLKEIDGFKIHKPEGAFYFFPNIEEAIKGKFANTEDYAEYLLENYYVSTVPGEAFGEPGFIRISFASSIKDLKEGINRIKKSIQ